MSLRVLGFLHAWGPGGVERDTMRLWRALAATGLDSRLVLGRLTGRFAGESDGLAIDPIGGATDRTASFETLWMIFALPRRIRSAAPDILYCPGNAYSVVAVAMRLSLGRRCPPIILRVSNDLERRDMPWPLRQFYHLWVRLQMHAFAHVIAMAPAAAAEIARIGHIAPERITTILNPCFTEAELGRLATAGAGRTRHTAGTRYLAMGRLAPQKNFALLIRAFAHIAGADDQLVIAGEGAERAQLEALAAELGVADRVSLPGHALDVAARLGSADVFVLSSRYEGLGVVILEALAAGLPVVATDCGAAISDLVAEGRGRLVPNHDVAALADAMLAAANPGEETLASARIDYARQFTVERALPVQAALFARFSRTSPA